jgi:hypothetical protein
MGLKLTCDVSLRVPYPDPVMRLEDPLQSRYQVLSTRSPACPVLEQNKEKDRGQVGRKKPAPDLVPPRARTEAITGSSDRTPQYESAAPKCQDRKE